MSALDAHLVDYLSLRRSLGYKLARPEKLLSQFLAHLDAAETDVITVDKAVDWARQADGTANWWAYRLSCVRGFATYLQVLDARHEVPAPDLLPARPQRATPYLYNDDEIARLIDAANVLKGGFRTATYQTLVGLLAVTGMRVGEAIRLDTTDFDPAAGVVTVRWTKFDKTRILPLHPTTSAAVAGYLARPDRPASPALLCSPGGPRLLYCNVHSTFQTLRNTAGLPAATRGCRPRIHDFRHRFAVQSLLDAYRDHTSIGHRLALLSTYMGHVNPAGTYWYLSAAPELLALATDRLDQQAARR